ncbi:MAG TPA: hypothetical protein VKR52_11145 [Terracidiphilus sp.]|nr:hypothetical protein [Terracidiphilus sp.]
MQVRALIVAVLVAVFLEGGQDSQAASHKTHAVFLGAPKHVPYSKTGDPAGAAADEKELKIRALIVDGVVKEWTTGESHDVTDRSFVIRRALRLNDSLPGDKPAATGRWVWQRGPWILIDRSTGHVTALKLPDYDPGVSQVSWFRDYAAYCGLSASGKSLYAVVAQLTVRKPVLAKKLAALDADHSDPACAQTEWQRDPLQVTFHPAGNAAQSFNIVPGSAALVEESDDAPETPQPAAAPQ